jgi:hypothetical protein
MMHLPGQSSIPAKAVPSVLLSGFLPALLPEILDHQIQSGCGMNLIYPSFGKQIPIILYSDPISETLQTVASAPSIFLTLVEFVIELLGRAISAKRIVLKFRCTQLLTA